MAKMINVYDLITLQDAAGINTLNNFKKYLYDTSSSIYPLYMQEFVDTYAADVMSDSKYIDTILNQVLARTTHTSNLKDVTIPQATEIKDIKESVIVKYFNKTNILNTIKTLTEDNTSTNIDNLSTDELINNIFSDVNNAVLQNDVIDDIKSLISLDGMTRVIKPSQDTKKKIRDKVQSHFYDNVKQMPLDINSLLSNVQSLYNSRTLDTTLVAKLGRSRYIDNIEKYAKLIKDKEAQKEFIESKLHPESIKLSIIFPVNRQYNDMFNILSDSSLDNFSNLFLNIFNFNKDKYADDYIKLVRDTYHCVINIINVLENILSSFKDAYIKLHRVISQNISDGRYGVVGSSHPEHSVTINSRFGKNIATNTDSMITKLAFRFGNKYFADKVYYIVNMLSTSATKIGNLVINSKDDNEFEIFSQDFYENIIPSIIKTPAINKEINISSGNANTRTANIANNIPASVAINVKKTVLDRLKAATNTSKTPYNRIDAINTIKDSLIVGDNTTEVANNINTEINNIKNIESSDKFKQLVEKYAASLPNDVNKSEAIKEFILKNKDSSKAEATNQYINTATTNIKSLQLILVILNGILNNNIDNSIIESKLTTKLFSEISSTMNSDLATDLNTSQKEHLLNKLTHTISNTIDNFMKSIIQQLNSIIKSSTISNIADGLYETNILSETDLMNYCKSQVLQKIKGIIKDVCTDVGVKLSNNKVKAAYKSNDIATEINNKIDKLIDVDYIINIANSPDTILKRYISSLHDLTEIPSTTTTYKELDDKIKNELKNADAYTRKMITDSKDGIKLDNKAREVMAKEITAKTTSLETYNTSKPMTGKYSDLGRSVYEKSDKTAIFSPGITNEQMNTIRCAVIYLLFCDDDTRKNNLCNLAKFITFSSMTSLNVTRDSNGPRSLSRQGTDILNAAGEDQQLNAALDKFKDVDSLDIENHVAKPNISLESTYKKNDNLLVEFLSKLVKINNILKG